MKRVNEWLADRLAVVMATMWLFWIIVVLCIASYVIQPPTNAQGQILFWVSILFQGAALPVLAFVSNKQGDRAEVVAHETHDAVMEELAELKQMHLDEQATRAEMQAAQARIEMMLQQRIGGR